MKEEKYKGCSLEELLEDQDFVNQIISMEKTVKLTTHFQFKLTTSFGAK